MLPDLTSQVPSATDCATRPGINDKSVSFNTVRSRNVRGVSRLDLSSVAEPQAHIASEVPHLARLWKRIVRTEGASIN